MPEQTEAAAGRNAILRAVMDTSPLAVIALDEAGVVRMWSRGAERMFGWRREEIVGQPLPTVPPELDAEFRRLLRSQFEGASFEDLQTVRIRKDGSRIPVQLRTAPLFGKSGQVMSVVNLVAD